MDSPRSGFLKKTTLLQIETNLFDLIIKGKPYHPTVETLELHRVDDNWVNASLRIAERSSALVVDRIQVFSPASGQLEEYDSENVLPCFYENQSYQLVIQCKNTDYQLEFHHDNIYLREAVEPVGANHDLLVGVLNFRNEIGYTDFQIRAAGDALLEVRLEIFPSKMDYKSDYEDILRDVNEEIHNLAFDFLRKTYNLAGVTNTQDQSLNEYFSILQTIFDQLVRSVERIGKMPHHRLEKENRVMVADKIKRAGRENLAYLAKRPHLLVKDSQHGMIKANGHQYRPTQLLETRRRIEYDTAENRFVQFALTRIQAKLKEIRKRLNEGNQRWKNDSGKLLADRFEKIERMEAQLSRLLRSDFLQGIGQMRQMSVTLVLQMAPGYRDVFRIYLLLLKGLSLQGDLFKLSMKDVAQLYEYWCFLKLNSLLRKKYKLVRQNIVRVNRNGITVKLDKSQSARVEYRNPHNGENFVLYYNTLPKEAKQKSPTLGQQPDNVLKLVKAQSNIAYNYVFDAKYKLNPAHPDTDYGNRYKQPGPEEEDINTMHRYRDAIVYQEIDTEAYERSMFGAYVLFPYRDQERFEEHHFYKSIKKVNVGALPFLPGSTRLVEEFLDELILDSPEKAFERAPVPRGAVQHYKQKHSGKNVLIGALGDVEQLPVCLEGKFYYMPLKNFRQQQLLTALEWVGIYQSVKKFKEDSGIHWIGKIAEWKVVRRKEIVEQPVRRNNAEELYVRFEVTAWEKIRTIESRSHYVQRALFTTKYMLDRAVEVAELRLDTEEQLHDWREKRRQGRVKVELDHEYADLASEVLSIEIE